MVDQLLEEFEHQLSGITLIPSRGGVYEVELDGELVFSKKALERHAEYEEVAEQVRSRIG